MSWKALDLGSRMNTKHAGKSRIFKIILKSFGLYINKFERVNVTHQLGLENVLKKIFGFFKKFLKNNFNP